MPTSKDDLDQYQGIEKLLKLMQALRDKESGCPWDVEQTWESIAPYTIEEAYEVADAIDNGNDDDVCEELGDLLLQVVFQAQIATESGLFTFDEIAQKVADKMIRRHPHVFGDVAVDNADDVITVWDAQKDKEKASTSLMDQITLGLPALMRAQKIQKKAIKAGFKWQSPSSAYDKLAEEIDELREAGQTGDQDKMREEYGDVLYAAALLGRYLGLDAEECLRAANGKFIRRFQKMEQDNDISSIKNMDEEQIQTLWNKAKKSA